MHPNAGHIILPISPLARAIGDQQYYDSQKKVWKRTVNKKLPGRALVVQNTPYKDEKGNTHTWNPLQAACQALRMAKQGSFDVIRVITPGMENVPGERAIANWDFSVKKLVETIRDDGAFFDEATAGKVTLEDDARSVMPYRWALNVDSHIWAPTT